MRKFLRFALVSTILSTSLLSLATPRLTSASCIAQTPEEQLAGAEIVVRANITDVVAGTDSTTVTAAVEEVIKGDNVGDTITFVTGSGTTVVTSVDVTFEKGDQYELYLYRNEAGEFTTNTCTGTAYIGATLFNDGDNTNTTNTNVATTDAEATTNETDGWATLPYAVAAVAVLALLGAGIIMMMRKSKP